MLNRLRRLLDVSRRLDALEARIEREATYSEGRFVSVRVAEEDLRLTLGRLLVNQQRGRTGSLAEMEFRVYSQWGDDGIIQYLIHQIPDLPQTFVEFGVEDYNEANTRFLLENDNWRGLVMDASEPHMAQVQSSGYYWRHHLTAKAAFITTENVNNLISSAGFNGEIGLLHIDVDGNDYWVWEAVDVVQPIIAIIEYNSVLGADRAITIPYESKFNRTEAHYSNLYFGASLPAVCHLAERLGYAFIGSNSAGNNAYFIRNDRLGTLEALAPKDGYVAALFRQSRDKQGNLTYLDHAASAELIRGLPVLNVLTGEVEPF